MYAPTLEFRTSFETIIIKALNYIDKILRKSTPIFIWSAEKKSINEEHQKLDNLFSLGPRMNMMSSPIIVRIRFG